MKTIDAVNGAIDSPTKQDKILRNLYNAKDFDFLGLLEKGSHRQVNHDPVSGIIKAVSIDPVHGMDIYMAHAMLDKLSNELRDVWGTDKRDMLEILFSRSLSNANKKHYRKTMRRRKIYPFQRRRRYLSSRFSS